MKIRVEIKKQDNHLSVSVVKKGLIRYKKIKFPINDKTKFGTAQSIVWRLFTLIDDKMYESATKSFRKPKVDGEIAFSNIDEEI